MTGPAIIYEDAEGNIQKRDEITPEMAAALGMHAMHAGVAWFPDCPQCQERWPDGQGWGES